MEECEDGFEFEEETEDQMDGLRKEHLRWIWMEQCTGGATPPSPSPSLAATSTPS